jgi:cytidine deaminase
MTPIQTKLRAIAQEVEPVSRMRLAAAILYKNKIVSIGTNKYKTHPVMKKFCKNPDAIFLHAEVDAIHKATKLLTLKQLEKATLVVVRVKQDGSSGLAKPCAGCQDCIDHYKLKEVVYTL